MTDYKPGTITCERLFAIICADCNDEDQSLPDRTFAERSFRRRGWSKTVRRGWICGACKGKKAKPESA